MPKALFAAKIDAALTDLRVKNVADENDEHVERAEVALKQAFHKPVTGASGDLKELGKNMQGGAPRVFLLRRYNSYFFVAAALEEGNSGCPEISVAKQRSSQIVSLGQQPTLADYRTALGTDYQVDLIP